MPKDDDHLLVPLERAHSSSQRKWHMLGFRKAILVAMAGICFNRARRSTDPTRHREWKPAGDICTPEFQVSKGREDLYAGYEATAARSRRPMRDTWGDKSDVEAVPHPIPATPFKAMSLCTSPVDQGLGSTRDGCFSGMPLSWLQLGPARADRGGLYAQTLTRSRNWMRKRPMRGEHRSLRAGHEEGSAWLMVSISHSCSQIRTATLTWSRSILL